jgi:hypothetical protein
VLKRLAILAAVLAALGSPPPIPGQTANHWSQTTQKPENQTEHSKNPPTLALSVAVSKDCNGETIKNDPDCKKTENKESSIAVSKLITANITIERNAKRDVFDWIAYVGSILLVVVGIGGVRIGVNTLKTIEKQTEISRKALVAQFRPRIEVRRIQLNPPSVSEFDSCRNGIWEIQVHIINRGGTVAHVGMCEVSAYWEGIHPNVFRDVIGDQKWKACSIEPGDTYEFTLQILKPDHFRNNLYAAESVVKSGHEQYSFPVCQGFISYRDDNGCTRDVAFDRDWDIKKQRFIPSDDPESEYSD